jgi:hypothetical protein
MAQQEGLPRQNKPVNNPLRWAQPEFEHFESIAVDGHDKNVAMCEQRSSLFQCIVYLSLEKDLILGDLSPIHTINLLQNLMDVGNRVLKLLLGKQHSITV